MTWWYGVYPEPGAPALVTPCPKYARRAADSYGWRVGRLVWKARAFALPLCMVDPPEAPPEAPPAPPSASRTAP